MLEVGQLLDADVCDAPPRHLVDAPVQVLIALNSGPAFTVGPRFTAAYRVGDAFELLTDARSVGKSYDLIYAHIHTDIEIPDSWVGSWNVDPQDTEETPLLIEVELDAIF